MLRSWSRLRRPNRERMSSRLRRPGRPQPSPQRERPLPRMNLSNAATGILLPVKDSASSPPRRCPTAEDSVPLRQPPRNRLPMRRAGLERPADQRDPGHDRHERIVHRGARRAELGSSCLEGGGCLTEGPSANLLTRLSETETFRVRVDSPRATCRQRKRSQARRERLPDPRITANGG